MPTGARRLAPLRSAVSRVWRWITNHARGRGIPPASSISAIGGSLQPELGLTFGLAYVTASIPLFISLKVVFIHAPARLRFLATGRKCALVAVLWMVGVIYVAAEFAGAMKPRAGADEDVPAEPLWAVVAGRSTVIGGDVIVAIGA